MVGYIVDSNFEVNLVAYDAFVDFCMLSGEGKPNKMLAIGLVRNAPVTNLSAVFWIFFLASIGF